VELQISGLITNSRILTVWVTRGIFYAFIGVLGLQESPGDISGESKTRYEEVRFVEGIAYAMIAVGLLYFCMGVLCLQLVYNKMTKNYRARMLVAKQKRSKSKHKKFGEKKEQELV